MIVHNGPNYSTFSKIKLVQIRLGLLQSILILLLFMRCFLFWPIIFFLFFLFSCRLAGKLWSSILLLSLSLDNVYPLASYECEWHNFFDQSYMLDLVQTFSNLFQYNQTCSKLFKVVQTCSKLFKLVQSCSNLIKVVQTFWNLFKLVQNYSIFSNLFKHALTCSNMIKLVQNSLHFIQLVQTCPNTWNISKLFQNAKTC